MFFFSFLVWLLNNMNIFIFIIVDVAIASIGLSLTSHMYGK